MLDHNDLNTIHNSCTSKLLDTFNHIKAPDDDQILAIELSQRGSRVFWQVYMPLYELTGDFPRKHDFFVKCAYFAVWTAIIDKLIDDRSITSSQRSMCQYIADCLLEKYFLIHSHLYGNDFSEFKSNIIKFFYYTYHEKNWNNPEMYMSKYFDYNMIYYKAIVVFTPIRYVSKHFIFDQNRTLALMSNYYSLLLLCDDIVDIKEDILHKTLTYPICYYFENFKTLPKLNAQFEQNYAEISPRLCSLVHSYLSKIISIEEEMLFKSVIIENTIQRMKQIMEENGIPFT